MDKDIFLQRLRDLSLEEGRAYIQEHIAELDDHAAIGNLLADEARRLLYTPFVSLKLAELLVFYGEYVHHRSSHALGLKAKGDVLMIIRHLQAAIECLDAAGEEFLRLGDEGNWARSRISWIVAAGWLGRVEEALQEAARARDTFLRLDELYWACVVDNNTAIIYEYIGQYREAIKLYERAHIVYASLSDQDNSLIKRSVALVELNRAFDLIYIGQFREAINLLQQAYTDVIALGAVDLMVNAEVFLAGLDYTQGYYGSALRRYYQALDSIGESRLDNPTLLAEIKVHIADCFVKLNRAQEACLLAKEAAEIYEECGVVLSTGDALREYASALVAAGRQKEALDVLDEAWTLLDSGSFYPYAFATKYQQAEILLKIGSFVAAYEQAKLAKEYFEVNGLVEQRIRPCLVMAGALIELAKQTNANEIEHSTILEEAVLLGRETTSQARHYHLQEEVYRGYYLLGQIAILQKNFTRAMRYYSAAIAQIERILDNLVYDFSSSFLQNIWAVYEDMIALCLQQGKVERAFAYLEQARSMALRQYLNGLGSKRDNDIVREDDASLSAWQQNSASVLRMQQELRDEQEQHRYYSVLLADFDTSVSPTVDRDVIQQELERREKRISELYERLYLYQRGTQFRSQKRGHKPGKVERIDITFMQQSLSPDQTLLAYSLYKDKLVMFALTKERLVTRELPGGVGQLEYLLPLLHAHLDPRSWPDVQKPPEKALLRLLNKLYTLLIAPVAEFLPSSAGLLTIVPYGPLHNLPFHALHDGSRYLVENFQVQYLPASSILLHLEAQEQELSPVSTKPPLVFAYSSNKHLRRVQDEAETVASLLGGQCYLEDETTIARLIEQAPGSPIIHIATHGQSRLDAPNFSFVRLADGQLNAIDAFSMDLQACELVTLSGCETGLALSGGGDEQLGLGRAFLAAGASSLVISLWPVEDSATNALMKLFYRYLLQGESKVRALQSAQCQLLRDTSSVHTHPFFWAAFRLVGDVAPLKFRTSDASFAEKNQLPIN
jgi:CHAT domain-containing protein